MRIGSKVYWCKYIGVNEYEASMYNPPVAITTGFNYFTCQPITERGEIQVFGENSGSTWKVMIPERLFRHKFKVGKNDVFYIDGAKPLDGDINGEGANAVVDSQPTVVNRFARIYLTKRTEE